MCDFGTACAPNCGIRAEDARAIRAIVNELADERLGARARELVGNLAARLGVDVGAEVDDDG